MKLNVIIFKNLKINAFTTPNFTDVDPEIAATQLQRAITMNFENKQYIDPYKNLDMYTIGVFDDETGKLEQIEPRFLCSPRELILSLVAAKVDQAQKEEVPAL